jgi:hypothetical protein
LDERDLSIVGGCAWNHGANPSQLVSGAESLEGDDGWLVCADGGNPDPTSTHGKTAQEAKALELAGWQYPRHLAGRLFSVVVHGDTVGAETLRRSMSDWASDLHMVSAGSKAELDAYVGYFEPYATSHQALDRDPAFQEEVRQAATVLAQAVQAKRDGKLVEPGRALQEPRPK